MANRTGPVGDLYMVMPRSAHSIQDELLVLAAQAGDGPAFEALLRRWLPALRRHAERLTGDRAAAEDVTQEACVAIARGLARVDDPALAGAWMLRIVTHKAADWLRRGQRDRRLRRSVAQREPRGGAARDQEPLEREDRMARVRAACRDLPLEMRSLVSMYYGEGMTVAAVAAALAVPAGTIKSRLHDAREQVRAFLERSANDPGG